MNDFSVFERLRQGLLMYNPNKQWINCLQLKACQMTTVLHTHGI